VVTGLVTEKQVQDLPLNNRSLLDLPTLETEFLPVSQVAAPARAREWERKISISGHSYNANLYQLTERHQRYLPGAEAPAGT